MQNPNYWGSGSSRHQKQDQNWKNNAQQNRNSWYGKQQQYVANSSTNSYVNYYQNTNNEKPYESCTEYFTYPQESASVVPNNEITVQSTSTTESQVAASPTIPSRDPRTRRHSMTALPHTHQTTSVSTLATNHTIQQPDVSSNIQMHSSSSNQNTVSSCTKLNTYISTHYSSNSYSTSNSTSYPVRNRTYGSPSYFKNRSSPNTKRFEELSPYIKSDFPIPCYSTASPEKSVVNSNQTGTIKERMHFAPKIFPDMPKVSNMTVQQSKGTSFVRQRSQKNQSTHPKLLPEKPKASSFQRRRSQSNSTDSIDKKIVDENLKTSHIVSTGKDRESGYVRHKSNAKITTESVPSTEKEKSIQNLLSKLFTEKESSKPVSKTKIFKKSMSEIKDYGHNRRKKNTGDKFETSQLSLNQQRPKTRLSMKDEENGNEGNGNNLETQERNAQPRNASNRDNSNLLLGKSKVKYGMKKKDPHKIRKQTIEDILFAMENSGSNDTKMQSMNVKESSSTNLDFTNSISQADSITKELGHHTVSCNDDLEKKADKVEKEVKNGKLKNDASTSLDKNKHDSNATNNSEEVPEKELSKNFSPGKRKKNISPSKQKKLPITNTRKRNQINIVNNIQDPINDIGSKIKYPNKDEVAASNSEQLLDENSTEMLKCDDLNLSIYNGEHDKNISSSPNHKQLNNKNIQTKEKELIGKFNDTVPNDEVLLSKDVHVSKGNKIKLYEKRFKSFKTNTKKLITTGKSCSVVITCTEKLIADNNLLISDSSNVNSHNEESVSEEIKNTKKQKKSKKKESSSKAKKSFPVSNEISSKSHLNETNSKVIVNNLETLDNTDEILSERCNVELLKERNSLDVNEANSFTLEDTNDSDVLYKVNNFDVLDNSTKSNTLDKVDESIMFGKSDSLVDSNEIDLNNSNKTNSSTILNVNDNSVMLSKIYDQDELNEIDESVILNEINNQVILEELNGSTMLNEMDESLILTEIDISISNEAIDSSKLNKTSDKLNVNDAVLLKDVVKPNDTNVMFNDNLTILIENNDSDKFNNIAVLSKSHDADDSVNLSIIDDSNKLNKTDPMEEHEQLMIFNKESVCSTHNEAVAAIPFEKDNSQKLDVLENSSSVQKFASSISIACDEKNELLENKDPSAVTIDPQIQNETNCVPSTNIASKFVMQDETKSSLILNKPDQSLLESNLNNLEMLDQIDSLSSSEGKTEILNETVCSIAVNDTDNFEIKSISPKIPVIEYKEVLQDLILNTTTKQDNIVQSINNETMVYDSNLIKCQKSKKSCKRPSVSNEMQKAKKSFLPYISDNKYENDVQLYDHRRLLKYNKMKKRKFREFIENQKRKSYSDSDSTDENEFIPMQNRSMSSAFKSFSPHLLSSSQNNFSTNFHSNIRSRDFCKTWRKMDSSFRVAKKSLVKSSISMDAPFKPVGNRARKTAVSLLRKDEQSPSEYSNMNFENGFNLIGNEVADLKECGQINHSESEPEIVYEGPASVDQDSDCDDMGRKSSSFSRSSSPIKDMVLFKTNCSCTIESVTINSLDAAFEDDCQGKDSVNGEIVSCTNTVSEHELLGPSSSLPFVKYCDVHKWRLRNHHCCPECGIFCTHGTFIMCLAQLPDDKSPCHLFHKDCFNILNPGLPPGCPHCSRFSDFKVVTLEDKSNDQISTGVADLAVDETNITSELENCCILMKVISTEEFEASDDSPLYVPCKKEVQSMIMTLAKEKALQLKPSGKCLYVPVKVGDAEKVLQMIAIGVNPNQRFAMYNNNTPLHVACSHGFKDIVHILIQAGALVDAVNNDLYTPLMLAVNKGFTRIVQHLIKAGARVELRGEDGMTCFHFATRNGDLKTAQILYETGNIDIDAQDEGGWTPIVWACEHSHLDMIKWLLEIGADINIRDNEENVSLHWAVYAGEENVVSALLDYGCNLNAVNKLGDSPIHIAARKDHYKCVKLLAYNGAILDKKNKENMSPIMCCPDCTTRSYRTLKSLKSASLAKLKKLVSDQNIVIRDVSRGKEVYPVQVINEIDEEEFIMDFRYILGNCCTTLIDINIMVHKMQMCYCQDNCSSSQCICSSSSVQCWYDVDGHLISDFDMFDPPAIFECNKTCHCPKTCINRVVQHGLRFPLQLFRTYSKGWGVRSLKSIRKGAFVCEYVGELITNAVANQRENDTYLFDLGNSDESYCLDTQFYGNISRFLNHSCDPNLIALKVFVEHQDLNFPRIAFFALKDIDAFEELCFDYGINFWIIKCRYQLCTCGSLYCKYSRDSIDNTLEQFAIQNIPS